MVILSTLASIEFYEDVIPIPRLCHQFTEIKVAPDGRCFWSCMWLARAAFTDDAIAWFARPRSELGHALGQDSKRESMVVFQWAKKLENMPRLCRERLETSVSVETEDIETCKHFAISDTNIAARSHQIESVKTTTIAYCTC